MDAIFTMAIIITFWPAFLGETSNTVFKSGFVVLVNGALIFKNICLIHSLRMV